MSRAGWSWSRRDEAQQRRVVVQRRRRWHRWRRAVGVEVARHVEWEHHMVGRPHRLVPQLVSEDGRLHPLARVQMRQGDPKSHVPVPRPSR